MILRKYMLVPYSNYLRPAHASISNSGHSKDLPQDAWAQSIVEEDLHIPIKAMRDALDTDCEIKPVEFRWKPRPGEDSPR